MTFTNYISLIEEQRQRYPNQPKNHYFRFLPRFNVTAQSVFDELVLRPFQQMKFVNTVEFDKSLYSDVEDLIYAEFVNYSLFPNSSLNKWRYYYIPQSYFNTIVEGTTTFKEKYMPYQWHYDTTTEVVEKLYPEEPFLFSIKRPGMYSFYTPFPENVHPYAPSFIFTGVYFINNNSGKYIYEYVDFKQFFDFGEITYYSNIRPVQFYVPRQNINQSSFNPIEEADTILIPKAQTWAPSENFRFFYLHETSNQVLSKKRRLYTYSKSTIEIEDTSVKITLFEEPPVDATYDLVNVHLGGNMGLNILVTPNKQTLSYNQTSSNNILKIGTNNP